MRQLTLEIGLSVIVILALALIPTGGQGWLFPASDQETVDDKAVPYTTHEKMLLVSVTIFRDRAPLVEDLTILPQGRASLPADGENRIELLDEQDLVIHTFTFPVDFLSTAHGGEESTEVMRTYILPYDDRAWRIAVTTPAGQTVQQLP
jgi:hypothetical protein